MKRIFIILLFFITSSLLAQPITWQRAYKEPHHGNDDESYCMCPADGPNIYIAGLTSDPRAGFVLKLNQFGDTLWYKYFNYEEFIYGICRTDEGGCIFGGSGRTLTRLDPSGNSIWQKNLDSLGVYYVFSKSDSNYFFSAYSATPPLLGYVGRVNSSGTIMWLRTETSFSRVIFAEIQSHPDGGIVAAGSVHIANQVCKLVHYDNNGNLLWEHSYSLSGAFSTTALSNAFGGYVIGGVDRSSSSHYARLLKVSYSGDSLRHTTFLSSQYSFEAPLLNAGPNKLYFSFLTDSTISLHTARIVMCDSMLTLTKQVTIMPKGDYLQLSSMMFAPNSVYGEINLTGTTNLAVNSGSEHSYVARIDSSLNILPPPIAVNLINTIVPQELALRQNYPNPFNPQTRIMFEIPSESYVKLTVFDVLGREVMVLTNGKMKAGTYEAVFNGEGLSSGMYFYELSSGDFKQTRKMILVK